MKRRLVLMSSIAAVALASVPAYAHATFIPGPNGKIVFTSGRANTDEPAPADNNDNNARLWVADWPNGTPVQLTKGPKGVQHRHPSWSPDHTRVVYAAGAPGNSKSEYALRIVDLRTGSDVEFAPVAEAQDRPSWSPDGTRIAYGSNGDLWVKEATPGATPVRITETAEFVEERPVWSPDGQTLYYNRGKPPVPPTEKNIYKKSPVTLAGAETPVANSSAEEWQPALSPDGQTLCYTRGPMNSEADLYLIGVNGGLTPAFAESASGNINCVWSPDGTLILYTLGVFTGGNLAAKEIDGTQVTLPGSWGVDKHFDGNADWATNFAPECDPVTTATGINQFTTIQLSCVDPDFGTGISPPAPTATDPGELEIATPPVNGAIGGITDSGTVIYTPNKDFQGTDTFTYTADDDVSEAPPATVTINVGSDANGGGDRTKPVVSNIKVAPKRWRLGNQLAKISLAPIGTTISFRLSEAARATLAFQRQKPGRRVGRRCVKQTAGNRRRKACKRFVGAGKVTKQAKAGRNRVRFQGLLTKRKKLKLGAYRVVISARDAAGNRSAPRTGPTFTIVKK